MLRTFLFVPANNLKFITKSKELLADNIVFDLEDAVLENELVVSFQNLLSVQLEINQLIRFRFFDENSLLNEHDFCKLLNLGFRRFVVPKFSGVLQAEAINCFLDKCGLCDEVSFVLLLEDPASLLSIYETLSRDLITVTALALGSHDYCNEMGMKHTDSNLYFARHVVLNHAKAFGIDAIDTVSVNIEDDLEFKNESLNAFNMGFDGKFVIHPRQLSVLKRLRYYTEEEVREAEFVYEKLAGLLEEKSAVVKINGKVYEKPHVKRILNIIGWRNKYGIE